MPLPDLCGAGGSSGASSGAVVVEPVPKVMPSPASCGAGGSFGASSGSPVPEVMPSPASCGAGGSFGTGPAAAEQKSWTDAERAAARRDEDEWEDRPGLTPEEKIEYKALGDHGKDREAKRP